MSRGKALLAAICAALALVAGAPPAHAQKRIALLIGNQGYKPGVGALVNPLNDIRIVGDALGSVGFEVLTPAQNVNREALLLAVHEFAAKLKGAGADAVGFLYYSGHGIASEGENFLIPVNVDEPSTIKLRVQAVRQSEVLTILRGEAPNAAHYLVLDACRNTLQGARGAKGFVSVGEQSGVLVAFSTAPGKTALDTGQGSGPYAAALAAELMKPGQSDLIMFHNVRVAVMDKTRGDQVPWTEDGIQRRQRVLFGGESKPAAVAAPVHPQPTEAERAWRSVETSTDIRDLEAFRRQYGKANPFYDRQAERRIEELKKQLVAVAAPPPAPAPVPSKPAQPAVAVTPVPPPARCEGVETQVGNERRCLKPKDSFKDCPDCPEMVVIPAGEFTMGSPSNEEGHSSIEGPQHKVGIAKPFGVGRFEVTFAEWDACVATGSCKHKPNDYGWGRGKRPVIDVSWDDAKEYMAWLSKKTGRTYRLLSEAEWEYAARAGTTTPFSTGRTISTDQANFNGDYTYGGSAKGVTRGKTIEVGSLNRPSAFGLHDMHGNVWEWVEDCYKDNYSGALTDGRAVGDTPSCSRVLRGGSWVNLPQDLRSAFRFWDAPGLRFDGLGFRVARTLSAH